MPRLWKRRMRRNFWTDAPSKQFSEKVILRINGGGYFMTSMSIPVASNKKIGLEESCFIIAEIGANHNRSLQMAKELIDMAVEARANAVKLQIYSADSLYSKKTPRHSGYDKDLHTLIGEIETPREWLPELALYCEQKGILFFATPFDVQAVDELDEVSSFFKIASFELVDLELLRYCALKGKPLIISTGLANMEEIEQAYLCCRNAGNEQVVFSAVRFHVSLPPPYYELALHGNSSKSLRYPRGAFRSHLGHSYQRGGGGHGSLGD